MQPRCNTCSITRVRRDAGNLMTAVLAGVVWGSIPQLVMSVEPPSNLRVVEAGSDAAPDILGQPGNQGVMVGQSATFTVHASGIGPFHYQWTFHGTPVGGNEASYTRSNCQLTDSDARVRVAVSNEGGVTLSSWATLIVTPMRSTYFASITGSSRNSGLSPEAPWSLPYALAQAGPSNIITFLPGIYPSIEISRSGTILRSQVKWGAKVLGTRGTHGIWTTGEGSVSNVVVDGFEVAYSYIDGVKFNGDNSTVRNCWIHHAGKGDPRAVLNSTGRYSGQGIAAHNKYGTVIENNLVEYCGMWQKHDHGIYINGTNNIVRNNVLRFNLAHGIQVYEDSPQAAADCQIYNNLIYGNGRGVVIYTQFGHTNYVFNNTIISTNLAVEATPILVRYAPHVIAKNNICIGNGSSIGSDEDIPVTEDFNVVTTRAGGSHDVVTKRIGFVNPAIGLYWLAADSPARGHGDATVVAPTDFFGEPSILGTQHVGAFAYSAVYAADSRVLEPSPPGGADYWGTLGQAPAVSGK